MERVLADSVESASKYIMAGKVLGNNQPQNKPGRLVGGTSEIGVLESKAYVGRGALKLKSAIACFKPLLHEKICADVGSSTGGFTEVLLEEGAAKVYAIDVGYGELDWKLRKDNRVVVMERTNARTLQSLPEKIDFASIDVSFISLKLILPSVISWLNEKGEILALIKPQFEAEVEDVGSGGVIKDQSIHKRVLQDLLFWCRQQGLSVTGLVPSKLLGAKGNQEYFIRLSLGEKDQSSIEEMIEVCFERLKQSQVCD